MHKKTHRKIFIAVFLCAGLLVFIFFLAGEKFLRIESDSQNQRADAVVVLAGSPVRESKPATLLFSVASSRPVQTTTDLRSFWSSTYPDVRKQLRGRYPKHPWPEDPWTAPPGSATKPRRSGRR